MYTDNLIEINTLNSLEKVFLDSNNEWGNYTSGSMLKSEKFSFQIAMRLKEEYTGNINIKINSKINDCITLKEVISVPSELPTYENCDDNYLRTKPGLFPDLLINTNSILLDQGKWRALWVLVDANENTLPGEHLIQIYLNEETLGIDETVTFKLQIIDSVLQKQKLIHTEWLHCDCIAQYHEVDVFSDRFWELTEKYIQKASDFGVNMILTPIFTPPLDTKVGGERLTVQLIDVNLINGEYSFNFDNLNKWVEMCQRIGIEYFEFSHLFTQWGAGFAPKIIANEDGNIVKLFGWHTPAKSQQYKDFLRTFLPELKVFIHDKGIKDRCYFHVSDEPELKNIEEYKCAYDIIRECLKDEIIIDALSDYAFYKEGIIKKPIPASSQIDVFIENKVENLWTYYCCGQFQEVSNRFMAMPSARNRILGIQLYKYQIEGFLHWGFNFYNSQFSLESIDPYLVTDAKLAFPSGDAFLVYPTNDGVTESIRLIVFNEALQDLRALQMLESLTNRQFVLELLENSWDKEITFKQYPKEAEFVLGFREKINELIKIHAI